VRVKRLEIGFETATKHSILNVMMQSKQMRMSSTHANPHDSRPAPTECTCSLNGEEELRHRHVRECFMQRRLMLRVDFTEKTHREVQLLCR